MFRLTQSLTLRAQRYSLHLMSDFPEWLPTRVHLCVVTLRSGKIIGKIEKNYTPHLYNSCKIGISCSRGCDLIALTPTLTRHSRCRQTQTITIDFLSGDQSSSPLAATKRSVNVKRLSGDLLRGTFKGLSSSPCSKSSSEATIQVNRYLINVCSKVQDLKEPPLRRHRSFCRIQRIGFFEKAARRLITIYRDEPAYWNTSELLKAFCMRVHVCMCACVSYSDAECFREWLIISVTRRSFAQTCDNGSDERFCSRDSDEKI